MGDRLIHQRPHPEMDGPVLARRRRRIVGGGLGVLTALVLLGASTQTSFFGRWILRSQGFPSEGMIASAESFRLVGGSRVVATGLKVVASGGESVFECDELNCVVNLWDWMRGRLSLNSLSIKGGSLEIFTPLEGTGAAARLWALLARDRTNPRRPLEGVRLGRVVLEESQVRFRWERWPGAGIELRQLNVKGGSFTPGRPSSWSVSSVMKGWSQADESISLQCGGDVRATLLDSGRPVSLEGKIDLSDFDGSAQFSGMNGVRGALTIALTPSEVASSGLELLRGEESIALIKVQGPFDSRRLEGRLDIETGVLSRPFLNMASLVTGLDFGSSKVQGAATLNSAFGGNVVSMRGEWLGREVEVIKGDKRTPRLALDGKYAFRLDRSDQSLLVRSFHLGATRQGVEWGRARLGSPVIFRWGDTRPGIKAPEFTLRVNDVNMKAWAWVFGGDLPSSRLSLNALTTIGRDGLKIVSGVKGRAVDMVLRDALGNAFTSELEFDLVCELEDLKRLSVTELGYHWRSDGLERLEGDGAFSIQWPGGGYSGQLTSRGALPWLIGRSGRDAVKLETGRLETMVRVNGRENEFNGTVTTGLSNLRGRVSGVQLTDHRFDLSMDLSRRRKEYLLNRLAWRVKKGYVDAGSIAGSGRYDSSNGRGSFRFQSTGMNRHSFGSWLDKLLPSDRWGEAELKISGELDYRRGRETLFRGKAAMGPRGLDESERKGVAPPGFEIGAEGTVSPSLIELSAGTLKFAETSRAMNQLQFRSTIPLEGDSRVAALTLSGEKLDLDRYRNGWRMMLPALVKGGGIQGDSPKSQGRGRQKAIIRVDGRLGELLWADTVLSNLSVKATLGPGMVAVDQIEVSLGEGKIRGRLASRRLEESNEVSIDLSGEGLPLPMLLRGGGIEPAVSIEGDLDTRIVGEWRWTDAGLREPSIQGQWQALVSEMEGNWSLANAPGWVDPMVRALNLKPEKGISPRSMSLQVRLSGREVEVENIRVRSDSIEFQTQGVIELRPKWKQSPVNLPVRVSNRLPEAQRAVVNELPSFLSVAGTLAAPQLVCDQSVVADWINSRWEQNETGGHGEDSRHQD
mgnify:CR=1 FL=1